MESIFEITFGYSLSACVISRRKANIRLQKTSPGLYPPAPREPDISFCNSYWSGLDEYRESLAKDFKFTKLSTGIIAFVFGAFGAHKLNLGYIKEGVIMMLGTLILFIATVPLYGIGGLITVIIGLVEGVIYLSKTDSEFATTYILGKRPWF
jgi:TM2 domain-containing membrane protein YozV